MLLGVPVWLVLFIVGVTDSPAIDDKRALIVVELLELELFELPEEEVTS